MTVPEATLWGSFKRWLISRKEMEDSTNYLTCLRKKLTDGNLDIIREKPGVPLRNENLKNELWKNVFGK